MVETVVSNGDVDGGHELISSLLDDPTCKDQVNAIIYGSVLKGYRNSRRMERVLQVFDEMLANGIAPIQTTYNVVIDACTRTGQADRVPGLVVDMRSRGMEPNLITYSTIIKGFCQGGNMKAALDTLNDMRSNGRLKPDEILYNTLLDGCAQAGLVVEGEQLLKEMLAEEIAPSSFTMTCMTKLLGQAGRTDRAFELIDLMSAKYGLTVNAQSGSLLIQACLSANDLDRAMSAHERLAAVQVQPDTRTCQALVRALIGADDHVRAIKLLRGLLAVHVNLGDQFLSEVLATLRATDGESKALAAVLLADVKKAADGLRSDRSFDDSRRRNAGMSGISGPGSCRQHRNNKVMCR
jgi:pentatricopeptide repeat protein